LARYDYCNAGFELCPESLSPPSLQYVLHRRGSAKISALGFCNQINKVNHDPVCQSRAS